MAFDIGHRFEPSPSTPALPERRTAEDWLDLALRILLIGPLIALYTWGVGWLFWRAILLIIPG